MKLMVIDLYHGDDVDDFYKVKQAGIEGIIHKSSQGVTYQDPAYTKRRKSARDAGLLWGAYHFGTNEDVHLQVDNFLDAADWNIATLLALDFEPNDNHTMSLDQAGRFLKMVESRVGRKIVLYSGHLIKEKLGGKDDPFFGMHKLWLAQYGPHWQVQKSWKAPWLWQNSETGSIPGIKGKVDTNLYGGSPEQLTYEWST